MALSRIAGPASAASGSNAVFTGAAGHKYAIVHTILVNTSDTDQAVKLGIGGTADGDLVMPLLSIPAGEEVEQDTLIVVQGAESLYIEVDADDVVTYSFHGVDSVATGGGGGGGGGGTIHDPVVTLATWDGSAFDITAAGLPLIMGYQTLENDRILVPLTTGVGDDAFIQSGIYEVHDLTPPTRADDWAEGSTVVPGVDIVPVIGMGGTPSAGFSLSPFNASSSYLGAPLVVGTDLASWENFASAFVGAIGWYPGQAPIVYDAVTDTLSLNATNIEIGGAPKIGTSYGIFDGVEADGLASASIHYTQWTAYDIAGSDIALAAGGNGFEILTNGWYVVSILLSVLPDSGNLTHFYASGLPISSGGEFAIPFNPTGETETLWTSPPVQLGPSTWQPAVHAVTDSGTWSFPSWPQALQVVRVG